MESHYPGQAAWPSLQGCCYMPYALLLRTEVSAQNLVFLSPLQVAMVWIRILFLPLASSMTLACPTASLHASVSFSVTG